MHVIYKYNLSETADAAGIARIEMPANAVLLDVQFQREELCLWAQHEAKPEAVREVRYIRIIGTGHQFPEETVKGYIATVQNGPFVWHVYEVGPTG